MAVPNRAAPGAAGLAAVEPYFGGSHNVGMVLFNGGSLYIDDGSPAPGLIEKTLRNPDDAAPTVYFNVPVGYVLLVPRLKADLALAKTFFRRLRVVFSLPRRYRSRCGRSFCTWRRRPRTTRWR
jgi:hypothetical protein